MVCEIHDVSEKKNVVDFAHGSLNCEIDDVQVVPPVGNSQSMEKEEVLVPLPGITPVMVAAIAGILLCASSASEDAQISASFQN
ncbi:hypothetical protein [Bifidobacterium lemurum]|uniref:hypothetical protein n=1 Tax=Bifidobacterium lemurum TaxID=1603886 RepID=UPI0013566237|nr:hypothetical protein [Bifidobacterium lemurum]